MDQAIYRRGERLECGDLSDELERLRAGAEGFLWIGLKDPTDDEFALVNRELGLHPLAVEDAVTGNQRAKIEQYERSVFVVLKTLRYIDETSDIETGELMLFIGDRFVVTVRRGEGNPLRDVRQRLELEPDRLQHGPLAVLHAVMDSVVDHYVYVDRELSVDLDDIEAQVLADDGAGDANAIYRLKREVLEFKRASWPLADALMTYMDRGAGRELHVDVRHLFRDVADHLRHVNDHIEAYDRLLTDILSAHLTSVSVQQNSDMRKISAWVAIAAIPTMVAGIYGMNFTGMPELVASVNVAGTEYYYGYFVVLALTTTACVFLWTRFKRSGWL
ncbi:magnesium and cobalt transport protein CorA [Intrasporangium calvum DSM 43043]|uniref:Magnesium and cobalt transport protein CorA n=1 Tax=Intrasporangium calvum (strain ATCC 23552 / DSM 43043 / JCM 3097 / NBRC 12989 / NCIMB 10167 / NRRL B-3866 / 7 KIP) TaxID=710696 RepID=E6SA52_INTC7|nr:magnesium and cobalt transport protein CorA [Intrasporangium calvum]ADU48262.1 magnesium and cobalt transport protein CorA [Intrasporangium calvum DSM 43043]